MDLPLANWARSRDLCRCGKRCEWRSWIEPGPRRRATKWAAWSGCTTERAISRIIPPRSGIAPDLPGRGRTWAGEPVRPRWWPQWCPVRRWWRWRRPRRLPGSSAPPGTAGPWEWIPRLGQPGLRAWSAPGAEKAAHKTERNIISWKCFLQKEYFLNISKTKITEFLLKINHINLKNSDFI